MSSCSRRVLGLNPDGDTSLQRVANILDPGPRTLAQFSTNRR